MSYHRWTREEEEALCATLDHVCEEPFSNVSETCTKVHLHFAKESGLRNAAITQTQIANKINGISRNMGIRTEDLLRKWEDHSAEVLMRFQNRRRPSTPVSTRKQPEKKKSKSNFECDESQGKIGQRFSVDRANEVEESSPAKTPTTPTPSPLSDYGSFHLHNSEPDIASPFPRYSMDLEEWEFKFLTRLREHRGDTGYMPPLPNQFIQNMLKKTMQLIDESSVDFMLGTRAVMPTSSGLVGESLDLTRLLFDSPRDGHTERRLKSLIAGPCISDRILFRAYAAAAIYEWVLKPFDDNLRHVPSLDCDQCIILNICEEYNHDIARNVSVKRVNKYLEEVIRPTLPGRASEIQEKLYNVFIGISRPSARIRKSVNEGFEFQDRKLRQWQQRIEKALLELLNMRTTMAQCSLVYGFRLPAVGHPFEAEWMEMAHSEDKEYTEDDCVYLCLRPAVFAHNRLESMAPQVLISRALVMLEGYEVDLTMT